MFKDNKSFWEAGTIEKRIGNVIYIVKEPLFMTSESNKEMLIKCAR